MPVVFGHHDLLPGNVMDDGKRLWLIDWEYGGFGTALFDLANLSANGAFGEAEDAALARCLFRGQGRRPICASPFRAMKAASALREAHVGHGVGRPPADRPAPTTRRTPGTISAASRN